MNRLDELESKSIYIIREAYKQFRPMAVLWSIGKDSTTLLWLCRKAFFGRVPFPVMHIDTAHKFKEIYEFRDKYAKEWGLNLIVARNEEVLARGISPGRDKLECCTELKTIALKQAINEHKFKALLLGIRRDEHGIRAKERYFSPRDREFKWDYKNQPAELWDQYKSKKAEEEHIRIHPLLHWSEKDVWDYVKREGLPAVSLYFAKEMNGKMMRYRSIGCETCCNPIESNADDIDKIVEELRTTKIAERSGRGAGQGEGLHDAEAEKPGIHVMVMETENCIFCRIVNREVGAFRIYESEHFLAFLDARPVVEGHTLLIPKRHFEKIYEINDEEKRDLGKAIYDVSKILERKFGSNINIVNTSGEHASQSIPHFHFHLIPRKSGDRLWDGNRSRIVLDGSSGFGRLSPSKEELENIIKEIKGE